MWRSCRGVKNEKILDGCGYPLLKKRYGWLWVSTIQNSFYANYCNQVFYSVIGKVIAFVKKETYGRKRSGTVG